MMRNIISTKSLTLVTTRRRVASSITYSAPPSWHRSSTVVQSRGPVLRPLSTTTTAAQDNNDRHLKLGFVGLGNMGLPMCINLAQTAEPHAHNILVHDLNESAVAEAEWSGNGRIHSVPDVADVAAQGANTVIVTMLPTDDIVHTVVSTLLEAFTTSSSSSSSSQCIIIDCSTVSPKTSRHWHEEASLRGHVFVDAPVSGGVKGAVEASLTFMVGITDAAANHNHQDQRLFHEILQPLLLRMGKRVLPCGARGNGSATKLCNNLALACQMIGIAEATNLGEALGVDPTTLTEVLNTSTAKCWSSEVNNPKIGPVAQKDYHGGFGSSLMLKDLGLAISAGEDMDVNLPLGTLSKDLYGEVVEEGLGGRDFGIILKYLAEQQQRK